MSDTLFALLHVTVLLALLAYAILCLFSGNPGRGGLLLLLLAAYYFLVLHKAVRKEIARKRGR